MNNREFDVLIIGSGPAGYVTAIRSAQLGFETAIVESQKLGGICLNWGCIPTKAMLRSAEIFTYMQNSKEFGVSAQNIGFNLEEIVNRSKKISEQLSNGVNYLLKKNQVTLINGHAQLLSDGNIEIKNDNQKSIKLIAKHKIIATGARPNAIPGIKPDGNLIWTYFDALRPSNIPNSILIIGAGAIGIEFASFFNALGTEVIVVEMLGHILPNEDREISSLAKKQLESNGIKFFTSTQIRKCIKHSNEITCYIDIKNKEKKEIKVEKVLSAVGVVGNIEEIGLENLNIKTSNGHIIIDEFGCTNQSGVYAIGDVAGPPWLAHKAEHEGIVCIENIAGKKPKPLNKMKIPGCTYGNPQVASVGLTESVALKQGLKIKIGRFPFHANGKAISMGETFGMIKTIFDAHSGQLLGAHMIGPEVTELIHGFVIAMGLETTEEELIKTIFPHPTLSEMLHESVLDAFDKAIHI